LALANSRRSQHAENHGSNHYDAKLLLLSVKNADKTLKPGDASYLQRLEMMVLLINHIHADTTPASSPTFEGEDLVNSNVAIGIIDEPTFVGKSATLLACLRDRLTAAPTDREVELSFLVGQDTLERLFSLRYYPSEESMVSSLRKFLSPGPGGDNSRVVSARRAGIPTSQSSSFSPSNQPNINNDEELPLAQGFINSGRIVLIDIGDELSSCSSTCVRQAVSGSLGVDHDHDQRGPSDWRKWVTKDVADYIVKEQLYRGAL
jgi:nicotinamide-nucleotide adenylyltransferase